MQHYIIVKYTQDVYSKAEMLQSIRALFLDAARIPGVRGAQVFPNCIQRENRYDLMIVVDMEKDALQNWDDSALHHAWKERYGQYIAQKTIFDRGD